MYTTTFYSFKGGVGRTMALMNVAVDLVLQGMRVLIIDLDLEAPGVSTFGVFNNCDQSVGMLDLIEDYLSTGDVPEVERYVRQVPEGALDGPGSLYLMGAGLQDESYGRRLNALDWNDLYSNHDGFLLLEDIKAQCESKFNIDYLLIDSRTGHTDVSGICTRQLPDAVVTLFFPNEQNLVGLQKVIKDIHAEGQKTAIHFVASNVPDLDDEEAILSGLLNRFQNTLGFEKPSAVIHHNNSLLLLNQSIFVKDRPKSSLAKEYRALTAIIRQGNERDPIGAKSYVDFVRSGMQQRSTRIRQIDVIEERLQRIFEQHTSDVQILDGLFRLRVQQGDFENGLIVLNALIDQAGVKDAEYHFRRAMILLNNGDEAQAIKDIRAGLQNKSASYVDLNYVAGIVLRINATLFAEVFESPAFRSLPGNTSWRLLSHLAEIGVAQPYVLPRLGEAIREAPKDYPDRFSMINQFVICSIAQREFKQAIDLSDIEFVETQGMTLPAMFNYAIAVWAHTGNPPIELFSKVLSFVNPDEPRGMGHTEANRSQCLSLAAYLCNKHVLSLDLLARAEKQVDEFGGPILSGWRFYRVSPSEFKRDLTEQREMLNGKPLAPVFMRHKPVAAER